MGSGGAALVEAGVANRDDLARTVEPGYSRDTAMQLAEADDPRRDIVEQRVLGCRLDVANLVDVGQVLQPRGRYVQGDAPLLRGNVVGIQPCCGRDLLPEITLLGPLLKDERDTTMGIAHRIERAFSRHQRDRVGGGIDAAEVGIDLEALEVGVGPGDEGQSTDRTEVVAWKSHDVGVLGNVFEQLAPGSLQLSFLVVAKWPADLDQRVVRVRRVGSGQRQSRELGPMRHRIDRNAVYRNLRHSCLPHYQLYELSHTSMR